MSRPDPRSENKDELLRTRVCCATMIRLRALVGVASLGFVVVACSSNPVDFTGNYNLTVTDGTNNCGFGSWTEGQASNVPATITQDPSNMSAAQVTITGFTGHLDLVLGTHTFANAVVKGDTLDANVVGTPHLTVQNTACGYTVNAHMQLTLSGNNLNGTIDYTPQTNGASSCGALNSCTNSETISGSR